MTCSLAQDIHLNEGVYAYVDVATALSKIDQRIAFDRTKCLGVVEGYLKKKHEDKICLDARSCRLLAVFLLGVQTLPCHFNSGLRMRWNFVCHPTKQGHH